MKKVLLSIGCAIFLFSAPVLAQSASKPDREEVTQLSAGLKDAYGLLSKQIAMLDREIGPDASAATNAQKEEREKLASMLAELESMLGAVNTSDALQWADVKAKAEASRARAHSAVEERIKR